MDSENMIKEYFNSRISTLIGFLRKNPVIALISILFFIFYSLPNMKLYFISRQTYSFLLFSSYFSILVIIVFYFANKKVSEIKQKSVFKNNNYLKGIDTPEWLSLIWGTSLIGLLLSALSAAIIDLFSIIFTLLNFMTPGNENAAATALWLSMAVIFLLFNNVLNKQLAK